LSYDEDPPELSAREAQSLLTKLSTEADSIVLIGGQALNFWAEYYLDRVPELEAGAPYTSKDIDFCGNRKAVARCAALLDGKPLFPQLDDATPQTGKVIFVDESGYKREIDFLEAPHGLTAKDVFDTSIPIDLGDLDDEERTVARFRVMQPVRCMESRVHNVVGLTGYRTRHGLNQLHASVLCAREYLRDLLDDGRVRDVLDLNERIFNFCVKNMNGKRVHLHAEIEPFNAVLIDERLPLKFQTERYPQMCKHVAAVRQKVKALHLRSVAR
jgi:hypothetical protein